MASDLTDLTSNPPAERRGPFKDLLAAWSLVVVVLAVAGFSSRWNYYYNFGLQHLVQQIPLTTLPIYAIEILRDPENLADLLRLTVILLLPFEILRLAVAWVVDAVRDRWGDRVAWRGETGLGLTMARLLTPPGGLTVDVVRAGLIVYIAFAIGGIAGTRDFRINVMEATSRLPKIVAILPTGASDAKDASARPSFACDTRALLDRESAVDPIFVGDPGLLRFLRGGAGCSSAERSWRLLLRDDKYAYLFATVSQNGGRPDTLVLPESDKLTLIMK